MCRRLACDGDDDDDVVDDLKITTDKILRLCENIELFDLLMLLSRNYTMCSWPTVYGVAFFLLSHIVILQKKIHASPQIGLHPREKATVFSFVGRKHSINTFALFVGGYDTIYNKNHRDSERRVEHVSMIPSNVRLVK